MILYYGILWGKGRVKRAARSLKRGKFYSVRAKSAGEVQKCTRSV